MTQTADFVLSALEFDVLTEHLELTRVPLVLRVPSPGRTHQERAELVGGVWRQLAEDAPELIAKYEAAGMRFSGIAVDPDPVALRGLIDLVERRKLRVHVQETFPFEHVVDAHRLLDSGHLQGKLVLPL